MPKSSEKAPQTGHYKPDCNGPNIHIEAGKTLPPCDHCHRQVNWTYIGP